MRGDKASPDWHQYSDMFLVILKAPMAAGCSPLTDPRYVDAGGEAGYSRGDCPVADDLYSREIKISLDQWYSAEDCSNIVQRINKVLSACCTEDPKAAKWL
ncbi:MAG: hypothetical protein GWP05_03930 [Anaerolineaceae bacterium]|nr:hypothetical protein [Anaerolineaceae bacterium]